MLAGVIERELTTAEPFVDYSGRYDAAHAEAIKAGKTGQQAHDAAVQSVGLSANWNCPGQLSDDDVRVLVEWHRMLSRGEEVFIAWQAIQLCQRGERQDDETAATEQGYPFAWYWHPEQLGELEAWQREDIEASTHGRAVAQAWIDSWSKSAAPASTKTVKPNTFEPANAVHVVKRCAVIREAYETGGADHDEPLWFAILRCTAHMEPDFSVEVSDQHPKFRVEELSDRLERIEREELKPATCSYISEHSDLCRACEWRGVVRSPLALAYDHLPKVKKGVAA